jgi:site-specific recombinase XerD
MCMSVTVIKAIRGVQRVAHTIDAGVHVLRHMFCSHLAMRGAPERAIQEVAGHADLSTTQRYRHLSPAAVDEAIRLLEGSTDDRGNMVATIGVGSRIGSRS